MRLAVGRISTSIVGLALLASGPAMSADLPVKAPPPVAVYDWTGFYVGGNIGGAWSKGDVGPNTGAPFPGFNTVLTAPILIFVPAQIGSFPATGGWGSGVIGGVQAGYNVQKGRFVFGVEGDIDGTSLRAKSSTSVTRGPPLLLIGPQTVTANYSADTDWIATFRGRIGFTSTAQTLLYATGGLAAADVRLNTAYTTVLGPGLLAEGTNLTASDRARMTGWTAGVGGEWMFNRNWSFGIEYRHVDLGSRGVNTGWVDTSNVPFFAPNTASLHYTEDQVTVRANWHWH
jgi:outer membrane immunogenic protein